LTKSSVAREKQQKRRGGGGGGKVEIRGTFQTGVAQNVTGAKKGNKNQTCEKKPGGTQRHNEQVGYLDGSFAGKKGKRATVSTGRDTVNDREKKRGVNVGDAQEHEVGDGGPTSWQGNVLRKASKGGRDRAQCEGGEKLLGRSRPEGIGGVPDVDKRVAIIYEVVPGVGKRQTKMDTLTGVQKLYRAGATHLQQGGGLDG